MLARVAHAVGGRLRPFPFLEMQQLLFDIIVGLDANPFHDRRAQPLFQARVAHIGCEEDLRDLADVPLDQQADLAGVAPHGAAGVNFRHEFGIEGGGGNEGRHG